MLSPVRAPINIRLVRFILILQNPESGLAFVEFWTKRHEDGKARNQIWEILETTAADSLTLRSGIDIVRRALRSIFRSGSDSD